MTAEKAGSSGGGVSVTVNTVNGQYAFQIPDRDLGYTTPFPMPFEPSYVYAPYIPLSTKPVFISPEDFKPLRKQAYLCAHCLTIRPGQWSRSCCLDFSTQPLSTSQVFGWI